MGNVKSLAKQRSKAEKEDLNASQALSPIELESTKEGELIFFEEEFREGVEPKKVDFPEGLELPLNVYSPNASGGDYKKAFIALGARDIIAFDLTSSAGDWGFIVKRRGDWHYASQNMCMDGGFSYSIEENNIFWTAAESDIGDDIIETVRERDPDYVAEEEAQVTSPPTKRQAL